MKNICIVGWGHTPFGLHDAYDVEALLRIAAREAVTDAGVAPTDLDATFVGMFNGGFSKQDFPSSLVLQEFPELRFRPAIRCENACASGSAAVYAGLDFIRAGRGRLALVIGVEKITATPRLQIDQHLLGASYYREEGESVGGFVGLFGGIAKRYFERHGDQSDALAMIAAKNYKNGVDNPYAYFRRDLGFAFCRTPSERNPYVIAPLKRTDCARVLDGAAALVLADVDTARALKKAIQFRAMAQVNDFLPLSRRESTCLAGASEAWARALSAAGLRIHDLSFAEVHDCFTIAELLIYETMGLAPDGQGARAILDGVTSSNGRLPVNRSGGLKAKGHPMGATGVSMHVMAAMQLSGAAGAMQLPKADVGAVFNMGGTGVANYVSILQRLEH